MHAYGHTLQRVGEVYLLALVGAAGPKRYCVAVGLEPVATYATLAAARVGFEARRAVRPLAPPRAQLHSRRCHQRRRAGH
jgi:hypothetical protein